MSSLSLRARGIAALGMLIAFPFLVALLVVTVSAVSFWLTLKGISAAALPIVLLFPLLASMGWAVWDVLAAHRPKPVVGHELTSSEHPALWAELDALATAMNQRRPDRIVVLPEVNAFVTTRAKRRELMIGYPLLAGLSRLQLRAVLAHELGHLAHGHTRVGWLSYRASGLLERTIAVLGGGQVRRLIVAYHQLYLWISISVLRDYERQADIWSARLAGGAQAASVFPELARLGFVWDLLSDRYLPLAAQVRARPPLSAAIRELSEARVAEVDEAVARQLSRPPSRWSTHPSDAERIQLLQAFPAVEPALDGREPAWCLLGHPSDRSDPDTARAALLTIEASLLSAAATTPASWEQVVHQAALSTARQDIDLVLAFRARRGPQDRVSLRGLLEILSSDSGRDIASALISDDLPRGYWQGALNIATARTARAALLIALADQGRARTPLRWDGLVTLEYLTLSGEAMAWPQDLTLVGPLQPALVIQALYRLVRDGIDVDAWLVTEKPGPAAVLT